MNIILFSTDLMITSQIEGAASATGRGYCDVSTPAAALQQAEATGAELVILDLSCPELDPALLVPQMKEVSPAARVIAFGPHVHADKLAAAQESGCDQVLSRGQFLSQLGQLFG